MKFCTFSEYVAAMYGGMVACSSLIASCSVLLI